MNNDKQPHPPQKVVEHQHVIASPNYGGVITPVKCDCGKTGQEIIDNLEHRCAELEKALAFYALKEHWEPIHPHGYYYSDYHGEWVPMTSFVPIKCDGGDKARHALSGDGAKEE